MAGSNRKPAADENEAKSEQKDDSGLLAGLKEYLATRPKDASSDLFRFERLFGHRPATKHPRGPIILPLDNIGKDRQLSQIEISEDKSDLKVDTLKSAVKKHLGNDSKPISKELEPLVTFTNQLPPPLDRALNPDELKTLHHFLDHEQTIVGTEDNVFVNSIQIITPSQPFRLELGYLNELLAWYDKQHPSSKPTVLHDKIRSLHTDQDPKFISKLLCACLVTRSEPSSLSTTPEQLLLKTICNKILRKCSFYNLDFNKPTEYTAIPTDTTEDYFYLTPLISAKKISELLYPELIEFMQKSTDPHASFRMLFSEKGCLAAIAEGTKDTKFGELINKLTGNVGKGFWARLLNIANSQISLSKKVRYMNVLAILTGSRFYSTDDNEFKTTFFDTITNRIDPDNIMEQVTDYMITGFPQGRYRDFPNKFIKHFLKESNPSISLQILYNAYIGLLIATNPQVFPITNVENSLNWLLEHRHYREILLIIDDIPWKIIKQRLTSNELLAKLKLVKIKESAMEIYLFYIKLQEANPSIPEPELIPVIMLTVKDQKDRHFFEDNNAEIMAEFNRIVTEVAEKKPPAELCVLQLKALADKILASKHSTTITAQQEKIKRIAAPIYELCNLKTPNKDYPAAIKAFKEVLVAETQPLEESLTPSESPLLSLSVTRNLSKTQLIAAKHDALQQFIEDANKILENYDKSMRVESGDSKITITKKL